MVALAAAIARGGPPDDAAGVPARAVAPATERSVAATPTALLFDASGALRYRGPLDEDRENRGRDASDLVRAALDAVFAGKPVEKPEPRAFGSSVRVRRTDQR